MRKTRIFAISGFSGSGKTTLLSKLIRGFREIGKSTAVIKNTKEDVLAPSGTDTRHHQDAGADPVVLLGPNTTTVRFRGKKRIIEIFSDVDADFLLLEGFKQLNIPKFWCIGEKEEMLQSVPEKTKAIVKYDKNKDIVYNQIPIVMSNEIETLLDIIDKEAVSLYECEL